MDVVIKTKFNKDYKFINLNKYEIFYKLNKKTQLNIKKFDRLELHKIKFFPPTYISDDLVFQQLAKGIYYRPNNLVDFNSTLSKNIAHVINILSSLKNNEIKISDYLANFDSLNIKETLNSKIINVFILKLKKYKNETFKTTLTHGDFKFEHIFILNNKLEYVVDWENVDERSILFDLLNFFIPWFVHRSFNYSQIKDYIKKFIEVYLPCFNAFSKKYDLYFSIFALERYMRINQARSIEFDKNKAYTRYNLLFKNLINEAGLK